MKTKTYQEKMRELRGFVDFNYDLRKPLKSAQKAKINRYYKELAEAKGQPWRIYKTKDKVKLEKIKGAAGMRLKGFTAALIPNYDPKNPYTPKIRKDGTVVFASKYEDKILYEFDKKKLVKNPEKELSRTLNKMPYEKIGIRCGKFEFSERTMNKADAKQTAHWMINTYNGIKSDGSLANNNYQNWLEGFYGVKIKNQKQYRSAMAKKDSFKSLTKKQRIKYLKGELARTGKNGKKKTTKKTPKNRNR